MKLSLLKRPTPRITFTCRPEDEGVITPPVGTVLEHPSGWRIEVTAGDETHVTRLRLHAPADAETAIEE